MTDLNDWAIDENWWRRRTVPATTDIKTTPIYQHLDPVWEESAATAPHPEPAEEYLVEIQQNLNGKDVRWHRVMLWCHIYGWNCEDSGKMIQLGPAQIARRWCKISEIDKGWMRERYTWKGE